VGTAKGSAWYFGFRPRDDQSGSLGYETRTLFEILDHAGAYAPTGTFAGINDNTEHVSRNSDYLATRFPNGTTVLVRHYRDHRENWPGGFSRNAEEDAAVLAANPLPPENISLDNFRVNGHTLTYEGNLSMAFRTNGKDELIAFDGEDCRSLELDGTKHVFSEQNMKKIAFAPVLDAERELMVLLEGEGTVELPLPFGVNLKSASLRTARGKKVKCALSEGRMKLVVDEKTSGIPLILKWK